MKEEKKVKLVNNLVNVTNEDSIYDFIWKKIEDTIISSEKDLFSTKYLDTKSKIGQILKIIGTDAYFLHYSLYPLIRDYNPNEILERVRKLMVKYMGSNEYHGIKALTTLNDELSLVYAVTFVKTIEDLIEKMVRTAWSEIKERKEKGDKEAEKLWKQSNDIDMALRCLCDMDEKQFGNLINSAITNARETTLKYKDVKEIIEGGISAGKHSGNFLKTLTLAKKIPRITIADEIITLGKKLSDKIPLHVRLNKVRGRFGDELSGYVTTRNVEKALPRELALPEPLFTMKLISSGFLSKEKLEVREGAYYVLIDNSGSMSGENTIWARAVALALLKLARKKKRKYFLRFFNTQVYPERKPITDPYECLDAILNIAPNGGTDIDFAIQVALEDISKHKLSDYTNTIILITDGQDDVGFWIEEFKQLNVSLVSIMIKGDNPVLKRISTKYLKAELTEEGGKKVLKVAEFS